MASETRIRQALVLGASSDIGIALCTRYLDAGYRVLAHVHAHPEALNVLVDSGAAIELLPCDLSDLDTVQAMAATDGVCASDAVVFLAAQAAPTSLSSATPPELTSALNVGALANYLVMGSVGPAMAERGWGRILIGSSIGVTFGGGRDSFAYALANHASEFIPREARDWAEHNVLTNVVRIGVTNTKMHQAFPQRKLDERAQLIPMRRPASVDEIADYLFWHGSAANSYVTGQRLAISGGE